MLIWLAMSIWKLGWKINEDLCMRSVFEVECPTAPLDGQSKRGFLARNGCPWSGVAELPLPL